MLYYSVVLVKNTHVDLIKSWINIKQINYSMIDTVSNLAKAKPWYILFLLQMSLM